MKKKFFLIEYINIFGEKVQYSCVIQKEFNEELQKNELFFVDVKTGYKIPYIKSFIKKSRPENI